MKYLFIFLRSLPGSRIPVQCGAEPVAPTSSKHVYYFYIEHLTRLEYLCKKKFTFFVVVFLNLKMPETRAPRAFRRACIRYNHNNNNTISSNSRNNTINSNISHSIRCRHRRRPCHASLCRSRAVVQRRRRPSTAT